MNQYSMWENYKKIFSKDYDISFLDKYFKTKTLISLKSRSQFCGCDYTNLYSPLFHYSRFAHSEIVALINYHFTHDKKSTIISLLHDIGTPCFAHVIDFVLNDSDKQESSEKSLKDVVLEDEELQIYLNDDGISLSDLEDLSKYPILENKTPKLCADRLDGVLGTCYIWLHTHSLEEISEVFDDICILNNEEKKEELGFKSIDKALKFAQMVYVYATELQGNKDKFVMQYIADVIKSAVDKNLFTVDDLYKLKEGELINIFRTNFASWRYFEDASKVKSTNYMPKDYFVATKSKKRNVIPLVQYNSDIKRICDISKKAQKIYSSIENYSDKTYGYVKTIKKI